MFFEEKGDAPGLPDLPRRRKYPILMQEQKDLDDEELEDNEKLPPLPEFPSHSENDKEDTDEYLPEFPDHPAISDKDVIRTNKLPTFPDSPSANKFSEEAIKDAVKGEEDEDIGEEVEVERKKEEERKESEVVLEEKEDSEDKKFIDLLPKEGEKGSSVEMELAEEESEEKSSIVEMKERVVPDVKKSQQAFLKSPQTSKSPKGLDVFIKLDKFRDARLALEEIREKLEGIDALIKQIKEIKAKEERELSFWEKDLLHATSRIADIKENIFEKVD